MLKWLTGIARNGVKTPHLITRLRIIRRDIASDAKLRATVTDEHLPVRHAGCASNGIKAIPVNEGVDLPIQLA